MDDRETLRDIRQENPALARLLGHRLRQRERSLTGSWEDFREYEIIEVLLNYVVPRQNMTALARRLADRFGSAADAMRAPAERLMEVEGTTPLIVEWLGVAGALLDAYQRTEGRDRIALNRLDDVARFLAPRQGWVRPPEAWLLFMDYDFQMVSRLRLLSSRPWWHPENMRLAVRDGVGVQARYAILVLFTRETPGRLDEGETRRLRAMLDTFTSIQIALLDCVVARGPELFSMRLHGRYDFSRDPLLCPPFREDEWGL